MHDTDERFSGEDTSNSLNISERKAKIYALKYAEKKYRRYLLLSNIGDSIILYSFNEDNIINLNKEDFFNDFYYFGTRFSSNLNELGSFTSLPTMVKLNKQSKENFNIIKDELSIKYANEDTNSYCYNVLIEANYLGKIYYDNYHEAYYFQINSDQVIRLGSGQNIKNINMLNEFNEFNDIKYVMNGLNNSFDILHSFNFDEELVQQIIDSNPSFDKKEYNPKDYFKFNIKDGMIFNQYFSLDLSKVLFIEYFKSSRGDTYYIYFKYSKDYTEKQEVSFTEFKEIQKEFHRINNIKETL